MSIPEVKVAIKVPATATALRRSATVGAPDEEAAAAVATDVRFVLPKQIPFTLQ